MLDLVFALGQRITILLIRDSKLNFEHCLDAARFQSSEKDPNDSIYNRDNSSKNKRPPKILHLKIF